MKPFYWVARTLLRSHLTLFYHHKVYGTEHKVLGKGIVAPNHASFLDPPIIGASWPEEIAFLARKTLFSNWFFSSIISGLNAYPINHTAHDLNALKVICKLLEENKKVVIFPEGVRTSDGNITPIKSGIGMLALRCQAPIIPTYIYGTFDVWNRHRSYPKLFGKTACVFGSPINPKMFSHLEKKEAQESIANKVKASIESLKLWYEQGAKGTPP